MKRFTEYGLGSCALGLLWYVALLIPSTTRQHFLEFSGYPVLLVPVMCLASLLVSALAYPFVVSGQRLLHILLALLVPVVGALTYAFLLTGFTALTLPFDPDFAASRNPDGPASGAMGLLAGLFFMLVAGTPAVALASYLMSLWISVPMGFMHVYALSWLARRNRPRTEITPDRAAR